MKNHKLAARISALVTAGLIVLGSHTSSKQKIILQTENKPTSKDKPYTQIVEDAHNFGVDSSYILRSPISEKYLRLKMEENSPVIIDLDENLDDREIKCIHKVVNYYNKVFDSVNENYDFKIKEESESIPSNSTVISIENQNNLSDYLSLKNSNINGVSLPTSSFDPQSESMMINSSRILLDWEKLKDKSDIQIYSVILHEFTHCFGFNDVYTNGPIITSSTINKETFLNINNTEEGNFPYLYPNDYAIIQALYSNEYAKHENYEDAVKIVNDKIENYTKSFYSKYSEKLIKESSATSNLKNEQLKQNITWNAALTYDLNTCNLEINNDNTCELSIYDNKGNLLEKSQGELVVANGFLFAKNITINNANNYNKEQSKDLKLKMTLCFYIHKSGKLVAYDGTTPCIASFSEGMTPSKTNIK